MRRTGRTDVLRARKAEEAKSCSCSIFCPQAASGSLRIVLRPWRDYRPYFAIYSPVDCRPTDAMTGLSPQSEPGRSIWTLVLTLHQIPQPAAWVKPRTDRLQSGCALQDPAHLRKRSRDLSSGPAAKRLTEITGLEAKTIYRLLEIDPATGRFSRRRGQSAGVRPADCRRDVVSPLL